MNLDVGAQEILVTGVPIVPSQTCSNAHLLSTVFSEKLMRYRLRNASPLERVESVEEEEGGTCR